MSKKKSDYPKTYKHPVTEQERVAANKAQEVSLKFDGYRVVEAEPEAEATDEQTETSDSTEKTETPTPDAKTETPKPAPKPGPTTTPKAQEGK